MSDGSNASSPAPTAPKERSPGFPFIPLATAIQRLEQFESYFGRHPGKAALAGPAWKMKSGSSKSQQTLAALKAFGFIDYKGSGPERVAYVTDLGRTYLRAQQPSVKSEVLRQAALNPKVIAAFFAEWGADRPPDPVCLDKLVLERNFTESAAPRFLRVYDETIAYAGLASPDKPMHDDLDENDIDAEVENAIPPSMPESPPQAPIGNTQRKVEPMASERVLASGPLSRNTRFRLLVEGPISEKEIEHLIAKLQLDKAIYADDEEV